MTINKSKDCLRANKRRREVKRNYTPPAPPERYDEVFDAIARLSESDRNALYLHYYEGYTAKEISGIIGGSERAITKRISRAREKLKNFLKEEYHYEQEAFDSLQSDEEVKNKRVERIVSSQSLSAGMAGEERRTKSDRRDAAKAGVRIFNGKRAAALFTAAAVCFVAVAVTVPVLISRKGGELLNAISKLENTFVDMDGVAAFGVWNAPESESESARISNVSYVHAAAASVDETGRDSTDENGDVITGDRDDEAREDWESDYDWDPTKANVLIAIGDDGSITEVVYERINGRGQVRQDVLGNAAAVYVSDGFTYVMYVNDEEWEFWKRINFAQYMELPNGFSCHHESIQTVVIHNATGKVFALKDLIPQVNAYSGATNYTMQAEPFRDDLLCVVPMYGNYIPQWYTVVYDEETEKIRYELILPADAATGKAYNMQYHVCAVRRDKYNQFYLLEGNSMAQLPRVSAGIVNLPSYTRYDDALVFSTPNGVMLGTDGRMYAFDGGRLKVFGENFELRPVEAGTEVSFEGIANDFGIRVSCCNDGIAYRLEGGYLYSMFGEVWKVSDDGVMSACKRLEGSFPRYADDGYLLGGEMIAFVDTENATDVSASVNGRIVRIRFDRSDGTPRAAITHIIDASEIRVKNRRMVVEQNENPYSSTRGETKYFVLTVQDGTPHVDYFAYGRDGGIIGLTKPITEPVVLS